MLIKINAVLANLKTLINIQSYEIKLPPLAI